MTRPGRRPIVAGGVLVVAAVIAVGGAAWAGVAPLPWAGGVTPTAALGAPRFVDETAAAGLAHVYAPIADIGVGGGVAAFDCSGDGKPELYLAGGTHPATLLRNDSATGGPLRFTPVGDATTDLTNVVGAYP
ncbi:MAG TPA: hypothetical protein VFR93_11040, partial [Candidatus Limnocylindrales bacterium]|nr:hypothetical protein [Candidatus Limnocylindrales bacterium]